MRFRPLTLRCECGLTPIWIKRLGLSPGHHLVVHCWCARCKRSIYIVKDLSDCWRECPRPEDQLDSATEESTALTQTTDTDFLRSLGIRLPDDSKDGTVS